MIKIKSKNDVKTILEDYLEILLIDVRLTCNGLEKRVNQITQIKFYANVEAYRFVTVYNERIVTEKFKEIDEAIDFIYKNRKIINNMRLE